ncbi:Alpha/Beta hydrolase protein [Cadophora sp. MPI-SDFR-AT-0126]|nr:Alpha/Beta hydrolase protein [Leotiomycetes sp. MPI-SDFR-AT-0126]
MAEALHPCCDPSSPSPIWEGNPRGEVIDIDGIETYICRAVKSTSTPEGTQASRSDVQVEHPKRIILFLTEGHGIYLPNAQLLADSFASHLKCDVLMPDQFSGQARLPEGIEPSFPPPPWWIREGPKAFEEWKMRHEPPVTDPLLARVVKYIHETYGEDVKIGGVGYCFGGRYVMRLMSAGILDVGVVNHPSFFTMEEVAKLGKGKKIAMYAAETDDILPPEKRRQTEDVLTSVGATWMSTVFSGTEHGFSVRGDLSIKEVRLAKERAFKGAVDWFKDWL